MSKFGELASGEIENLMFYRELQIDNVPGEMNRRNESRHATLHLKKSCQQRSLAASR